MNVITTLLFFLSGLFGGYPLLLKQIYHVSKEMTWAEAQSYCRLKYTDLPFYAEDLDKIKASTPHTYSGKAWVNMDSHSQDTCLAIDTGLWELVQKDCTRTFSFYCSQTPVSLDEGKRVVLRMKVNPGGQLDLEDPGIRSNMLAKINEKFNEIGFGDAITIRWITKRETLGKKDTCDTKVFYK